MSDNKMQAMYYIALECDVKNHNTDEENTQWKKANQNRLNQNFKNIENVLEEICERLERLESI